VSLNKKVGSTSWFVLGKATLRCVKGEFEREGSGNGVFLAIMKSLIQQKGPLSPFKTAAFNKSFLAPSLLFDYSNYKKVHSSFRVYI